MSSAKTTKSALASFEKMLADATTPATLGGVLTKRTTNRQAPKLGVRHEAVKKQELNEDALAQLFGNMSVQAAAPAAQVAAPARQRRVIRKTTQPFMAAPSARRQTNVVTVKKVEGVINALNYGRDVTRADLVIFYDFIQQQIKRIELKDKYVEHIDMAIHYAITGTENKEQAAVLEDIIAGLEGFTFGKKAATQMEGGSSLLKKIKLLKYSKQVTGLEELKKKVIADRERLVKQLNDVIVMVGPLRDELISRGLLPENDELRFYVPKPYSSKISMPQGQAAMEMEGGKRRRGRPSHASKK